MSRASSLLPLWLALAAPLAGCPANDDDDSTAADDDDTTDEVRSGLAGKRGEGVGTVDGYSGFEEWSFVAEDGEGVDVCRIRYTLTSTAGRDDCDLCDWAFDLTLSGAEIVAESDVGCAGVFGLDAAGVAAMDGTPMVYGYVDEYFGHASVLMAPGEGGIWEVVTYAAWDAATGALEYDWEIGYESY